MDKAQVLPDSNVKVATTVTVRCLKPKHYVMFGNKYVTCKSAGWSEEPECKKCGKVLLRVNKSNANDSALICSTVATTEMFQTAFYCAANQYSRTFAFNFIHFRITIKSRI